jgi:hypothetical protein
MFGRFCCTSDCLFALLQSSKFMIWNLNAFDERCSSRVRASSNYIFNFLDAMDAMCRFNTKTGHRGRRWIFWTNTVFSAQFLVYVPLSCSNVKTATGT